MYFNQAEVPVVKEHKHLGMILDSKLDFSTHVKEAILKARRGIGMICYMAKYVSRDLRDQIYNLYIRPHLDYGDIIYHKHDPEVTHDMTKRLERIQYSAALAVSGAWRGTNIDRLYEELGWESITIDGIDLPFLQATMNQSSVYLYQLVPPLRSVKYNLRGANVYESNVEGTNRFASSYFQDCIKEWNQLHVSIRSSQTISEFERKLIHLVRPKRQSYFGVHDIEGIRYLTQLRVKFSDLREHRSRHNFRCLSPLCTCGNGEENNEQFLLHCPRYVNQRKDYLDEVSRLVDSWIFELTSNDL